MNGYIQRLFGFICHRPRIGEMANYVTLNTCYCWHNSQPLPLANPVSQAASNVRAQICPPTIREIFDERIKALNDMPIANRLDTAMRSSPQETRKTKISEVS